MTPSSRPHIKLIAGEVSGDFLGAALMAALRRETGGEVRFSGVGGDRMAAAGLDSLFSIEDISVMGLAEVLPRAAMLLRRIRQTVADINADPPDALVSIDAPGFNFRVAKRLKARGFAAPVIHMVAPQTWAWRERRAAHLKDHIDHLLALLPFEPPLFAAHGLQTTFVGHPIVERVAAARANSGAADFRARHGIAAKAPLLLVLPGSRSGETRRLLPVLEGAVARMTARLPGLTLAAPTVPAVAARVRDAMAGWAAPAIVLEDREQHAAAFAAADGAVAASGTILLELALWGVPTVVVYRAHPLTAAIVRRLLRTPYVALPNILSGREVMPELLQENCRAEAVAEAMRYLFEHEEARQAQRAALASVGEMLGAARTPLPSGRAAQAILSTIGWKAA